MQQIMKSGSQSIRVNANLRSLWIEYPRLDAGEKILAVLFDRHDTIVKFNLPILMSDAKGIMIKLPSFISGMFYLEIQDGDHSFLRQIALQ